MRRWFLSYNSQDFALAQSVEAALRRKDPDGEVFFAPKSMRAGSCWLPKLADEIAAATVVILLVGEKGVGRWQIDEYYEARDKRVSVVLVLLQGQPAPGLPFLRTLQWIVTPDPSSEACVAHLMDAAAGDESPPGELWRYTAPYRGLTAMTEADSDYFFGRNGETVEIIKTLAGTPDKLPILIGNSGVGKSSLAQAGVVAALVRQALPQMAGDVGRWPQVFANSRQWCFLRLRPGPEPVKALVETFMEPWQFDAGDPERIRQRNEWVELLVHDNRKTNLAELLDETERRQKELNQAKPAGFFLYVDQGEELYMRAEERQRRRFSELLARGLSDPRLRALMSLRSDFLGALQNDEPLFGAHRQINVAPLREIQLRQVISCPAELLSARFESDRLASDIALRAAEESSRDAGALPLLSYMLDDMWSMMVKRGDGVLRLPSASMDLGRVLADRANSFLAFNPRSEEPLRRILTLKLATLREDGEPTRRRAARSEFTEEEWRIVSQVADQPYRLAVTVMPESGETYAEVAHEAIFRRWEKLRGWMTAEKDFLIWKSVLEADRRAWEAAPRNVKVDSLLRGVKLLQAKSRLAERANDLAEADRTFIAESARRDRTNRAWSYLIAFILVVAIIWSFTKVFLSIEIHGDRG